MKTLTLVLAGGLLATAASAQTAPTSPSQPNLKAELVMAMQQKLNERGFSAGRVDGLWGPDTSAAVRNFQQKNGLPPTGQLDQGTLQALGNVDSAAASPAVASPTVASPAVAPPATPDQAMTATPKPSGPPDTADPSMSASSPGTPTTDTDPATASADPAPPAASAPDAAPSAAPGTAVGRATDRTLGTNTTGTNPDGSNAGQNAAGGDRNQAVATTGANASEPAKGANSFTDGEARRRMESSGYSTVADLKKDGDGIWRGSATKDGAKVGVWLDYKGNIGQQ